MSYDLLNDWDDTPEDEKEGKCITLCICSEFHGRAYVIHISTVCRWVWLHVCYTPTDSTTHS